MAGPCNTLWALFLQGGFGTVDPPHFPNMTSELGWELAQQVGRSHISRIHSVLRPKCP
jgi:hypothetical protein